MEESKLQTLVINDTKYYTNLTKKFLNRKEWVEPDAKQVKSIIPGTITEINVKVGDSVNEGDIMFIHNAMKMRNKIMAPFNGKIKAVNVKIGQSIPKNFIILEFE